MFFSNLIRTILYIIVGYFILRVIRNIFVQSGNDTIGTAKRTIENESEIKSEDIEDAKFKDID